MLIIVGFTLQERQANIFNIVFAFLMLLTLLGFACVGVKLFLQKRNNEKMIINSNQRKHSVVGLVTQTLLQVRYSLRLYFTGIYVLLFTGPSCYPVIVRRI